MKKLIVSVKSTNQALNEIKGRLKHAVHRNMKVEPHYEISFTNKKDFKKFLSNIDILTSIQQLKPKSIYELSNILDRDIANLNKLINFFEDIARYYLFIFEWKNQEKILIRAFIG